MRFPLVGITLTLIMGLLMSRCAAHFGNPNAVWLWHDIFGVQI